LHRILIADDHGAVRMALRSLFDKNGFEVCGETVNGLDAIEKACPGTNLSTNASSHQPK
jgi:DNA-binding NarL/FixJ family response regulator